MDNVHEQAVDHWRHILKNSVSGEKLVVAQQATDYQSRGFTADEAIELLVANGASSPLARSTVAGVYSDSTIESDSSEAFDAARFASNQPKKIAVMPTQYSDVIPVIENSLFHLYSPRQFANRIARSNNPIVPVNNKSLETLHRLVEAAQTDDGALHQLHVMLQPFIENAIMESVELSEQPQNRISVASSRGQAQHLVTSSKGNNEVNLASGTCNCQRYVDGNFGDFGIPCEHIIKAALTISPTEKLVREFHPITE